MTATELLDLVVDGDTTFNNLIHGAIENVTFGPDVYLDTEEKDVQFRLKIAQTIIDAITGDKND